MSKAARRVPARGARGSGQRVGFRVPAGDAAGALEALTAVTGELAVADGIEAIVDAVVTHAAEALAAAVTTLMLVDGARILLVGGHGLQDGVEQQWASFPLDLTTPAGYAAITGETVVIASGEDVARRWPGVAERVLPGRSLLTLPLGVPPSVVGALAMTFEQRWTPGPAEMAVLAPFADACAQAVRRVRAAQAAALRERQVRFLADASFELGRSLDYRQTLAAVADLVVPDLADWCAVQMLEDGDLVTLAVAHADPGKVEWAWQLQKRFPPPQDAPTGAAAVVRTGVSELYEDIPEELLALGARDEEELELLRALRMRSALVVPLPAHGTVLGAITLIRTDARGDRYSGVDLAFAEDLGRRAGLAIDNAHLHTQLRDAALMLQRAVLPDALPAPPGWQLAAHYEPGGRAEAGGDFYDAMELADGRVVVVVGDVMGHGVLAAAAMAHVRAAVRTLITLDPAPGAVMARLEQMFTQLRMTRLVSLVYAVADRPGGRVELVSAGAMPPLLVAADGSARLLDVPPRPVLGSRTVHDQGDGVDPGRSVATVTASLPHGVTLLLYTDGLIERRGEIIDVGLARLLSVAAPLAGSELHASLRDVVERLREPAVDDDLTALALRLQ